MTNFPVTPKAAFLTELDSMETPDRGDNDRGTALSAVFRRATETLEWVRAHQTSVTVGVLATVAMPGTDMTIRRARADEWGGTFDYMLGAMLDLAMEGNEMMVTILAHPGGVTETLSLYRGIVHSFDGEVIQMFDGVKIARDNVIGMGV